MENEELVARIKAGIDTADNMLALWEQNRGMIGKLARRYSAYADIEDLQQEGYLALYDAIDGFKPDKGVRFCPMLHHDHRTENAALYLRR